MHKETYTNNPGKNLGKSPRGKPSIDLMCPDLPFVEHILAGFFSMECLKTGKAFTDFSTECLKNRKLVKEFSIARLKTGKG